MTKSRKRMGGGPRQPDEGTQMYRETEPTVVSMEDRARARDLAPLRLIEGHWRSLLNQGALPLRSEIDPRRIEDALEYAFIAEKVTSQMARMRVAGMHLNDLMGMAVSGMPLSTLIAHPFRPKLAEATQMLFARPALIRIELQSSASVWAQPMRGDLILLPLRSDMGDVTRALGGLVTQGRIGRTPRRFDIRKVTVTPIDGALPEMVAPERPAAPDLPETARRPVSPPPAPTQGAPWLRLVVSND